MEKSLSYYFLRTLNKLSYKYRFFAFLKNWLRQIKYFFLGESGIIEVIHEIKKARSVDNPVKIIFDIGAAVGDKTVTFLKSYPVAIVYCFEPQKESLDILRKRIHDYEDRVKIFDVGFLDKSDTVFLNINSSRDSSSILPLQKHMEKQGFKEIERQSIKVVKMDDFLKEQKIDHIDFVKIDVEGAEIEVLEGGKESFKSRIDNVFIEILPLRKGLNSKDPSAIFNFFYEMGFTFIGYYGDYFFSKDKDILKKYF